MALPSFILLLGVFVGGIAVYVAVSSIVSNIFENSNMSLQWASGEAPQKSKSGLIRITRPLVHRLVLPLIARYPMTDYKENIKRNIQSAGLGGELNESEYVGLQVLLGIIVPIFLWTCNALFTLDYPIWLPPMAGVFGASFPYFYVKGYREQRRAQILVDLPFVVDLLALSTQAGSEFIGALSKISEKLTEGPMAEEIQMVLRDLKLGSSRAESLSKMAWRLNIGEISSLVAVITTADSMGASIDDVLRQQAEQMRQERFLRAEKAGAEASQKIFLPIVVFILPAVLIIVFGPLILQFMGK